jgi:peptidoglycan-N-acetylglucosamine deacetylase
MLVAVLCGSPGSPKKSSSTTVPAAPGTTPLSITAPPSATVPTTTTTTVRTTTTPAPPPTSPPSTLPASPATLITRGRTDRKLVALTFDAGSDAGNTTAVLDILAANHIHATFGITGLWAQATPPLVRQIAAAGDQIVNHTWDHQSFTGYSTKTAPLSATQITQELARADTLIRQLTGSGTAGWFRRLRAATTPASTRSAVLQATATT